MMRIRGAGGARGSPVSGPPFLVLALLACVTATAAEGYGRGAGGTCGAAPEPVADTLPVPVLLVPGWGDDALHLAELRTRFIEAGWPPGRIVATGFRNPVGSNRSHAGEVASELRSLREVTGVDEVDVVAHSMGGLAVRYHLASSGGEGVRRVVFLGTPHRGTMAAHLAWGDGSEEMVPGSAFLDSLNAGPPVPEGVEALAVETPLDLRIVPGESARLPPSDHVQNLEVCCPTHVGLLNHPDVFQAIVEFLSEGRAG